MDNQIASVLMTLIRQVEDLQRQVADLQTLDGVARCDFSATAAPTTAADVSGGWTPGSLWHDTTSGLVYICVDNAAGAAVWIQLN